MKKSLFIVPLISLFVLSLLTLLQASVEAGPGMIRVPADYPTIQEAINAAAPESIILVSDGVYYEHLVVNKTLTLIGQDKATTIIDGNGIGSRFEDSVVYVTANGVIINGFTIRNSGGDGYWSYVAGIGLASNGSEITGNIIIENNRGIIGGGNTIISDNIIQNNNYGIYHGIYGGRNNVISSNTISDNHHIGVWFEGLSGNDSNIITDNIISNNQGGISLCGFIIIGGSTLNTRHNVLQCSSEVPPPPLSNNAISGNRITGNEYGITIAWSGGNTIRNNVITHNHYGVNFDEASNNTLISNTISNNNLGIDLAYSNNNTIYHNNFVENAGQLKSSGTSNIWDNGTEGNYWSDYDGLDDGSDGRVAGDGVGDTDLPHLGVDYYPIIFPWGPIPIVWDNVAYPVSLLSNSTVSTFCFIQADKKITFNVRGPSDTVGYCNVTILKNLLRDNPWKVLLNDTDVTSQAIMTENQTHTSIYFTYNHSNYNVQIIGTWVIPEFPTHNVLVLTTFLTLLPVILLNKKRKRQPERIHSTIRKQLTLL